MGEKEDPCGRLWKGTSLGGKKKTKDNSQAKDYMQNQVGVCGRKKREARV